MTGNDMGDFIAGMPKAELHLHIEGTLSPATILRLAARNGVEIPFSSVVEIDDALEKRPIDLQGFLDHHYLVTDVIRTGRDLAEITYELLGRCRANNIIYSELFFDPQRHAIRGIPFDEVIDGIERGRSRGVSDYGVEAELIMCINRELSVASAEEMLDRAQPHRHLILGLGMDSYEEGNPPRKFAATYARARELGYRLTAHCDVDQTDSVAHIWECLDVLGVERIDHGVNAIEDPELVEALKRRSVGLAAAPVRLNADRGPEDVDRIKQLYEAGVLVSINSDDPAEFASGYLNNLLLEVQRASNYTKHDLIALMANAFNSSWLPAARKDEFLGRLRDYGEVHGLAAS